MIKWGTIALGLMATYQTAAGQISKQSSLPSSAINALDQVYHTTEEKFNPKSGFSLICADEKLTVFDNDSTVYGIEYIVAKTGPDSSAYTSQLIYGQRIAIDKKQSDQKQTMSIFDRFTEQNKQGRWLAPNETTLKELQAAAVGNFPTYLLNNAGSCSEILHNQAKEEKKAPTLFKM